MAQQRPGTAVPRKPSPAVYRRRRLVAAVIVLLLIGLLVAAVVFVASLFGAETTEGKGQAGTEKAAAQGPQAGSDSAERAGAKEEKAGKDAEKNDGGNGQAGQQETEASKDDDDDAADEQQDAESTASPSAEPTAESTEDSTCEDSDVVVEASTDQSVYQQGENPVLTLSVTNEGSGECIINLGTSQMEYLITSGEDRIFSSTDCQIEAVDNYQTLQSDETEKAKLTWERNRTAPDCAPVETEPQPGTYTLVTKLGDRISEEETFRLE